jgi:hypothetical protein
MPAAVFIAIAIADSGGVAYYLRLIKLIYENTGCKWTQSEFTRITRA